MKNLGGLTKAILTKQLAAKVVLLLSDDGFIDPDPKVIDAAITHLSLALRKEIKLLDFEVELTVKDLGVVTSSGVKGVPGLGTSPNLVG